MAGERSVLVTGGFGFLGRHLVELLADGDARVHVVDDLSSGSIAGWGIPDGSGAEGRRGSIDDRGTPDGSGAEGRRGSIDAMAFVDRFGGRVTYDIATLREYAGRDLDERPRFDEIYHLASPVGPVGILRHAGRIAGAIVGDADRAVDLACRSGARLCLASTSEIYGGGRGGACAESDDRVIRAEPSVRLEYAAGKLAAEIATINAARHRGLRAVVIRPFNVAGPGQSGEGGFVLPRFVRQALSGEPITVYGDGSAVRALTHVDDVSDGIVRALRGGRSGAAYNLGNAANRTTILDLAGLVLRVTGSSSPISHVDPRDLHGDLFAEAPDKFPDGDLARRELGWSPSRDLERVVRDAVDDARSQM